MNRKKEIEEAYGRKKITDLTVQDMPSIIEYITIILDELDESDSDPYMA